MAKTNWPMSHDCNQCSWENLGMKKLNANTKKTHTHIFWDKKKEQRNIVEGRKSGRIFKRTQPTTKVARFGTIDGKRRSSNHGHLHHLIMTKLKIKEWNRGKPKDFKWNCWFITKSAWARGRICEYCTVYVSTYWPPPRQVESGALCRCTDSKRERGCVLVRESVKEKEG